MKGERKLGREEGWRNGNGGKKEEGRWREGEKEGGKLRQEEARVVSVWVPGGPMGGVFSAQGP